MKRAKRFNIFLSVLLSAWFLWLGHSRFDTSYARFAEALGDLWSSMRYYFYEVFDMPHKIYPSVEDFSAVLEWEILLPETWEKFQTQASAYLSLLFDKHNLAMYFRFLARKSEAIAKWAVLLLPCILLFVAVIKRMYDVENTDHNKDTKPLRMFRWVAGKTYQPIKRATEGYIAFLWKHRYIPMLWAILWVFHLNLASVLAAFLAYYLYFAVAFPFDTLYVQVCKLFIDLQVIFAFLPWWAWAALGYYLFCRFRQNVAQAKLRHLEARSCGFINELPIVSMTVGSMGKKKTTVITDMALSQEVMFRQKALELLQRNDMRFPHFPWIAFEMDLRNCMEHGTVYNLATAKAWVQKKRARFEKNEDKRSRLYGYDFQRYGLSYDDGLRVWQLHDVLEIYAQLYFIYVIESSLIVSNFSIRTDNRFLDAGNFPIWASDFFPGDTALGGRHAHILDFDVLRLGKKVIENNPKAGSFEFGVVVISEVGKERGNVLDHKELKKNQDETNQKNDLFNSWLKMCRHSATVDNFPFIKVFTDEQRPESWGADARDLCDIVHIVSGGKPRLALPFYTIEEMVTEWAYDRFLGLYMDFRYRRGDNTLLVHCLKTVTGWLYQRNARIYNRFGYSVSGIEKERGTQDGKIEKKKYYILNKKIYARRFSTDCFSDYFNDMARQTKIGLNDYPEYMGEKATVTELKEQNSYFINALYKK